VSGEGYIEIIKKSIQLLALIENTEPIQQIDKEKKSIQEICLVSEHLKDLINQHVKKYTSYAICDGVCPAELQVYAESKGWVNWK